MKARERGDVTGSEDNDESFICAGILKRTDFWVRYKKIVIYVQYIIR